MKCTRIMLVFRALDKRVYLVIIRDNFWLAWTKSRKSYCTTPGVGGGGGVSKKILH